MSRKSDTNTPPRAKQSRRAPLRLSPRIAHETNKKAQALQRLGLYSPREKVTAKTKFSARQERDIYRRFNELQSHRTFISGKGLVNPLKRTKRGYVLTDAFRKDKRKLNAPNLHIIKTRNGSIVPRKVGKIKRKKDGTIIVTENLLGKKRRVMSGTLTPEQTIKFFSDVQSGKFKFPNDTIITLSIFGNDAGTVSNIKDLRTKLSKYAQVLNTSAKFSPLTLEYIKL